MADEQTPEELKTETETQATPEGTPATEPEAAPDAIESTDPLPGLPGLGDSDKDEPSAQAEPDAGTPETEAPAAEPETPAIGDEPSLPGLEPAAPETETPAAEPTPDADPAPAEAPSEPAAEDKPAESEAEPTKTDAVTPQPELTGDAGGSSDAPAGDPEVKTEEEKPATLDDLGDSIEVACVGDPALVQGNANKVLKIGDDHQAVGIDNQVLAAASASAAARGVLWDAFCQVAGILGGTAFDLHRHVKKHHKGASKTESEWQGVVDRFLRESAAS